MSNEELVAEIQAGKTDMLMPLWEQNIRYVTGKAAVWKRAFAQHNNSFDLDDLIQSGWLALVAAVDYYNPEKECPFLTVFNFFIKKQFQKVIGIQSSKRDAMFYASFSLDAPLAEDDETTFGDQTPDPRAIEEFEAVENEEMLQQVRQTLDAVADELLNDKQWEVYQSLLGGLKYVEMAENDTVTAARIYQRKEDVFNILRSDPRILQLWLDVTENVETVDEIAEHYMARVGLGTFHESCASSVELAVERILKNEARVQGKTRRLKRRIEEKLHAEDKTVAFAEKIKQQQREKMKNDLAVFEQDRSERLAAAI